jgi:2,5-diamino-6-(ribosylamino)-4(3H)-pyrimidinone 5'-phosphate reductase
MATPTGNHRPYVLVHMAVSLDGSFSGFQPDVSQFYSLAAEWQEDATLVGADTILAQENELAGADLPGPKEGGPVLAVVDSGCRVSAWNALRDVGHWSRVIALRGNVPSPTHGVEEIVTGGQQVDLAAALAELRSQHAVQRLRVDSGGNLVGALMAGGLVDEISLLVHPALVADSHRRPWWGGGHAVPTFQLTDLEARAIGDDIVQLRYRLVW